MPSDNAVAVLLIHGTFANRESESGTAWWQLGSEFQSDLGRLLGPTYQVQPPDHVFRWDGLNSEASRRKAAWQLAQKIVALESTGRPYAFIGHSHGGSVLFDALTQASRAVPGLPGLQRWTTVGTPFLRYAGEANLPLMALAPAAVAATIAALFPLHWRVASTQWLEMLARPRFGELAATLLLDALLAFLLFASLGKLLRSLRARHFEAKLDHDRSQAFRTLESRYVGIFVQDDEAISGLGSTLAFDGRLVVRSRAWWGGLYNRFLAPIGDQFIWSQLSKRAQGNDIAGMRLRKVLTAPMNEARRLAMASDDVESLTERANRGLTKVASNLRVAMHAIAFGSQPVEYLRQAAQQSGAVESLVHTSYFADPAVRVLLCESLRGNLLPSAPPAGPTGPAAPGFLLLSIAWASGIGAIALALSLPLTVLLQSQDPQQMLSLAVAEAPFLAATYANAEEPYNLVQALAARHQKRAALGLAAQIQRFDDVKLARAAFARGLFLAGEHAASREEMAAVLMMAPTRSSQPRGVYGPESHAPSLGDLAVARMLGFLAMSAEAEGFIGTYDIESTHKRLAAQVVLGLVEGNHTKLLSAWMEPSGAAVDSPEIVVRALALTCDVLPIGGTALDPMIQAATLERDIRCGRSPDVRAALRAISDARARVVAACAVARYLAGHGRKVAAIELLKEERAAFPTFERHPLHGLAIHHIRYAAGLLDVGSPEDARAIMTAMEETRGEKYRDGSLELVADDTSPRERSVVWARLGDSGKALKWWDLLPEEMSALDAKFHLLSEIGAHLSAAGVATPSAASLGGVRNEDADRWTRMATVFVSIGEYDGKVPGMSRFERARMLESIRTGALRIDDPNQRSVALSRVAERFLQAGLPRTALSVAASCLPIDRLGILTKAVERYL